MFERIAAEHQKRNKTKHISPPRRNEIKNNPTDEPILPRKFAVYEADQIRRRSSASEAQPTPAESPEIPRGSEIRDTGGACATSPPRPKPSDLRRAHRRNPGCVSTTAWRGRGSP